MEDAVARWMEEHQVIHLFNLPHTPRHNAAAEHGNGVLKAECGLGKGCRLANVPERPTCVRELVQDPTRAVSEATQGPVSLLDAGARATRRVLRGWAGLILAAWERPRRCAPACEPWVAHRAPVQRRAAPGGVCDRPLGLPRGGPLRDAHRTARLGNEA